MTFKHRASTQRCSQLVHAVIFTFDAAQAWAFLLQLSETMLLSHSDISYWDETLDEY
jgi:hypothetical protein